MAKESKEALDQAVDEITSVEQAKTDTKMMLAARIIDALEAKNWNNNDLLEALGKEDPSVITKWLSGTHNFNVETLVEIERALGISFINSEGQEMK